MYIMLEVWGPSELLKHPHMPIIQRIYRKYMANYSGNIKGKLWLIIIQGSQDGGEGSPLSDAEKPAVGPKEPIRSPTHT